MNAADFDKLKRRRKRTLLSLPKIAVSLWTGATSATVHSFGIQREPSRPVGTAAEVVSASFVSSLVPPPIGARRMRKDQEAASINAYLRQKRQVAEAEATSDV